MRRTSPPEFKWRRRAGVFACLLMGSVMGWWIRDVSRAKPPAAYVWVREAKADQDDYWGKRWRRVNEDALVKAKEGEYLYWLSPEGVEAVSGPDQRRAPTTTGDERHPLWASRAALRAWAFPASTTEKAITVFSPVGVTRYRNPTVAWAAEDGKKYDVAVVDVEDERAPARLLLGVRPPLALLSLETTEPRPLIPGRVYDVLVRESGNESVVGAARVLVAEEAQLEATPLSPGLALFDAAEALHKRPYRTGDAWARLTSLPPLWASTELARRLRLTQALETGELLEAKKARDELLK